MTEELNEIRAFILAKQVTENIPEMEQSLEKAIGYAQRVGELANEAEERYEKKHEENVERLEGMEEQTETTRKALLVGWMSHWKKELGDLKTMKHNLRQKQMMLMQAIKTRRDEMNMR